MSDATPRPWFVNLIVEAVNSHDANRKWSHDATLELARLANENKVLTAEAKSLKAQLSSALADDTTERALREENERLRKALKGSEYVGDPDTLKAEVERLRKALEGILDIGKRDLTNPKYDGYFEEARAALNNPTPDTGNGVEACRVCGGVEADDDGKCVNPKCAGGAL